MTARGTGDEPLARFRDVAADGGWVVAFDTAAAQGSVALGRAGEVVGVRSLGKPREHAARLLPELDALLGHFEVPVEALAGIVVGAGPGSFTGVRVAAATAKGLWHGLRVPVWSVSSLLGAACDPAATWASPVRGVLFDARGTRVYGAVYRVHDLGVEELLLPTACELEEALALAGAVPRSADLVFGGGAAWRHRSLILARGHRVAEPPVAQPGGEGLLHALWLDPDRRAHENPAQWEPEYLRASSATRSRPESRGSGSGA